jgi:hypothetical protein
MIRIFTVNQTWLHRNFHSVFVSPKNWDTPWYTQNCHLKFWNKPASTMFNQFFWGVPYGVPCFWTVFLRLRGAQWGAAAGVWGVQTDGSLRLNIKKKNWQFLSIKSCNIRYLPTHDMSDMLLRGMRLRSLPPMAKWHAKTLSVGVSHYILLTIWLWNLFSASPGDEMLLFSRFPKGVCLELVVDAIDSRVP